MIFPLARPELELSEPTPTQLSALARDDGDRRAAPPARPVANAMHVVVRMTRNSRLVGPGRAGLLWKQQHRLPIKQRVIANARAAGLGSTIPWFIAQQSWNTGTTSVAVTPAQAAIANHSISIWTGRNADSITTGPAYGTHLVDTGADMYVGQWQTALAAFGAPF